MITSIHFKNFKALEEFSITIKNLNVLTGPNNNGKSTLLDGLRVLQAAYRYASKYNPKLIDLPFGMLDSWGYEIPESSIPIILENIQTNFNTDQPSLIKYRFGQGKSLSLIFHPDHPIFLIIKTSKKVIRTLKEFKNEFPLNISIVPTLGPFEIEEDLLDQDYVARWHGSRRSARMFRSYWFYNQAHFQEFKQMVEETWPGVTISAPEKKNPFFKQLVMFCQENRMTREVCWAGFGFQIWLQLLTHVVVSRNADLIVIDEPEIYLHPDLQHKVLDILKGVNANVLIATHSVEIINSVEPSDVLLIDKKNKQAKRITDLEGLQNVSNILGSGQNIQLTRLARGKKILFVEGKDSKLLSRLCKICSIADLFTSGEITIIPIEGFSHYEKVIHTNWAFTRILGEELKIAVLLDRDYKTDDEINKVLTKLSNEVDIAHVHRRKEIENYYIVPSALARAIHLKIEERIHSDSLHEVPNIDVYELTFKIIDKLKTATLSQITAHKTKDHQRAGKDLSTLLTETILEFEHNWDNPDFRIERVCGKSFFTLLNDYLQTNYKITISLTQVANQMKADDVGSDLKAFFKKIESFMK